MSQITNDFFKDSRIPLTRDSEAVMDFLSEPESVMQMIAMTKIGLPALAGVVRELENRFADCSEFPLNHDAADANAPNRRNVGWMVRHIMQLYGYTPVASGFISEGSVERTRLGKYSGSRYFATAAVYLKTIPNPQRTITITSS